MAILVSVFGVVIGLIGVMGLASPRSLIKLIQQWQSPGRFWFAVAVRVVLGLVFLAVAPECRAPLVVRIVGVVSIAAAIGILVMGRARLDAFIEWWVRRPPALFRLWAPMAIAFGALLVYAGP